MKYPFKVLFVFLASIGSSQAQYSDAFSSANQYSVVQQSTQPIENTQYNEAQLAQILAPIALYPDTLLTHILIAATYPIELVQAQRWLDKHEELSPEHLAEKIEQELDDNEWDASVKALMAFPKVVKRLSDDLDWVQDLGDAFLSDEEQVLASIQQLRKQAQQAGSLSQMNNNTVSYEGNNIIIEPAQAQIIYVPYYDSRAVYGSWRWAHYPPVYWSMPPHRYNRHYVSPYNLSYHQPFYWHTAVHIRHHFFFGAFNWHNRHVVVINHRSKSHNRHYRYKYSPYTSRAKIVTSSGAKRWQHKPEHRRGAAYRNKHLNKRYSSKQHHAKRINNTEKYRKVNNTTQVKSPRNSQQKSQHKPQLNKKYRLNNQSNKTVKNSNRSKPRNHHNQQMKTPQKHLNRDKRKYQISNTKSRDINARAQYVQSKQEKPKSKPRSTLKSTRKSNTKEPIDYKKQSRSNKSHHIAGTNKAGHRTSNNRAVSQAGRYKREK